MPGAFGQVIDCWLFLLLILVSNVTFQPLIANSQIKQAIDKKQLVPYYQPLVRLDDLQTVGYEALMRWNHPTRGLLTPAAFLMAAEEAGLWEELDWALYQRVAQETEKLLAPGQFVAVNVSAKHFQVPNLEQRFQDLLAKHQLPTAQWRLELTEGSLLRNPRGAAEQLQKLHDAGIRISLDDFGVGYSSLSHIKDFPLTTIKIDRSFIETLHGAQPQYSRAIVQSVLALAGALNLDVVAEGIETPEQLELLQQMGCAWGQGFLLGQPAPVEHWLRRDVRSRGYD